MEPAALTTATPPVLDKLVAAIAGAITTILVLLRLSGLTPNLEVPPDVVLGLVTSIAFIAATIRSMRETKMRGGTAQVVTELITEVAHLRELAASAAVTTPIGVPDPAAPPARLPTPSGGVAAFPPPPVKRQGGFVRIDAMIASVCALCTFGLLTAFACDGSSVGPGLVDVLSRVDARTVVRCAEQEGAGAKAACLGAAVATPALQVLLERASQAVQRASMIGPGGAGADDATDEDRKRAAADLDKALDDLSAEVARTHEGG